MFTDVHSSTNVGVYLFVRSSVEEILLLYSLFVAPSSFYSSNYDEKLEYVSRFMDYKCLLEL